MKDTKNINVRIPSDLHAMLVETAARERRSINAQILASIEGVASAVPSTATATTPTDANTIPIVSNTRAQLRGVAKRRDRSEKRTLEDLIEEACYAEFHYLPSFDAEGNVIDSDPENSEPENPEEKKYSPFD